jgi:hypothetical protein
MQREEIDFVINAIIFVAEHGWKFLHLYRYSTYFTLFKHHLYNYCCNYCRYNHKTGEWAHATRLTRFPERKWLSSLDLLSFPLSTSHRSDSSQHWKFSLLHDSLRDWGVESLSALLEQIYNAAMSELSNLTKKAVSTLSNSDGTNDLTNVENLRWFVVAGDIRDVGQTSHSLYDLQGNS